MLKCFSPKGLNLPRTSARALTTTTSAQGSMKNLEGEESMHEERTNIINIYSRINSWKTRDSLVDELVKGVVYKEGDLIALNKPYGLANHAAKDSSYSVEDCLNRLADRLEVGRLFIFILHTSVNCCFHPY